MALASSLSDRHQASLRWAFFHRGRCQLKTTTNLLHLRADEYSSWPGLKEVKPQVDYSVAYLPMFEIVTSCLEASHVTAS